MPRPVLAGRISGRCCPRMAARQAQTEVGAKTNEIPMLPVLLDGVDITGMVILADALHTQRATATYLHQREADFCFCVKETSRPCSPRWTHCPGPKHPSPTARSIAATAGSPPAPSRSCPHPKTFHSRMSTRFPHRALHPQPGRHPGLGRRSTGHHQPHRQPSRRRTPRRTRPPPLGNRVPALAPRHPLPRRPLHHPHPIRAQNHGRATQSRHQRTTPGRTHRHHRSHPLGQPATRPALHHPRNHNMILKRPWGHRTS